MFDYSFLATLKSPKKISELHERYLTAKPFPHLVLENVFSDTILLQLEAHFPRLNSSTFWWQYDNQFERKFAKDELSEVHPMIQDCIAKLQSRQFTDFLETVTGIKGLIVDQTLRGGGLHQIARGGYLDIHADHNYHSVTKLDRRLNVLLFLNDHWDDRWGGHLEFWDAGMKECVTKIAPTMGRLVVFGTNDTSFHGHPDPLNCPEGYTRKSIATYLYSNGRPESERSKPHSVLYQRRPQDPLDVIKEGQRDVRARGLIPNEGRKETT